MDTEARTLFEIPAENMPKFEEQIAKLSKKSVKLIGLPITPFVFSHEERKLSDGLMHRVYSVMLTAEVPKINGWTFVARLDHANDTGTIIRMVPNAGELPAQYRNADSKHCDHCGHARYRRDTFVIRNDETGETKQVGSSCLKDFFGHDPMKLAKMAELLGYAYEAGRGGEQFVGGDLRWIHLEDYLNSAAVAVRTSGWVSGAAAFGNSSIISTRTRADSIYGHRQDMITDEDRALAQAAQEWAISLRAKSTQTDYEHNIGVIAEAVMIEPRSSGLAASIVGVYFKNHNKPAQATEVGDFSGVIGLMTQAQSKLKFPKIRLQTEDGKPVVLNIAGARASRPGTVNVTDGGGYDNGVWYGRVDVDGKWAPARSVNEGTMTSLTALLTALAADPAGTASKYGKLTGQCCFCALPLTDARSTAVGYGKKCAENYGLKWGAKCEA